MSYKKEKIFCIIGLIFVLCFGTLSHFFYDLSGQNKLIGILFPANESTWEHLKLAIFPTLIMFVFGFVFLKNPNYYVSLFLTLLIPIILIPIFFYGYIAISKQSILLIDILTFVVSVTISWIVCYLILKHKPFNKILNIIAIIGTIVIICCYLLFTLYPPKMFLFEDPTNGSFGLKK